MSMGRGREGDERSCLFEPACAYALNRPPNPPAAPPCNPLGCRRWFMELGDFTVLKETGGFEVRTLTACLRPAWRDASLAMGPSTPTRVHARSHAHAQGTKEQTLNKTHAQVGATFASEKPSGNVVTKEYSWTQTVRISSPEGEVVKCHLPGLLLESGPQQIEGE